MTQIRLCWIMAQTTVRSLLTCQPHPMPERKGTNMIAATMGAGVPKKSGPICHNPKRTEWRMRASVGRLLKIARIAGIKAERKNNS